jgi:ankyrin repeat protein
MDEWYEKNELHFAAEAGDLNKVRELVEQGFDINTIEKDLSYSPLHFAVRGEHIEVARYLLSAGADVNAYDEMYIGETPLGDAAADCSYEIAELLVEAGADPTIPGWMQRTALDRARRRKKDEGKRVYELLLKVAREKFDYKE